MEPLLLPKYYENSPVLPQNFSTALLIPDPMQNLASHHQIAVALSMRHFWQNETQMAMETKSRPATQ